MIKCMVILIFPKGFLKMLGMDQGIDNGPNIFVKWKKYFVLISHTPY